MDNKDIIKILMDKINEVVSQVNTLKGIVYDHEETIKKLKKKLNVMMNEANNGFKSYN